MALYRMAAAILALALLPGLAAAQQKGPRCKLARPGAVVVYGADVPTTAFAVAELQAMPRQEVAAKAKDGSALSYVGVPVGVLLGRASGNDRDRVKHGTMTMYLVAEAGDGYRAVVAMPEADTSAVRPAVMVSYAVNGAPLDSASGPLQLVAPLDAEHGRWVRGVECLRVAKDPDA